MKTLIPAVYYSGLPTRLAIWMMCADKLSALTEQLLRSRKPQLESTSAMLALEIQGMPFFTRPPHLFPDSQQRGEHIIVLAIAARRFGAQFQHLTESAMNDVCYSAMELGMSEGAAGIDRSPPATFSSEPDLVIAWTTGYEYGVAAKARLTSTAYRGD